MIEAVSARNPLLQAAPASSNPHPSANKDIRQMIAPSPLSLPCGAGVEEVPVLHAKAIREGRG